MKTATKTWLIAAVSLVLIGCIICVSALAKTGWDFAKLSNARHQTNTYEISEVFSSITIKTDTADITFALSDDGKCKVECYEEEKAKHSVTVQDNTLVVAFVNTKSWYDYIGIHFSTPKIRISLPQAQYTSLSIQESTGDVEIPKELQFTSADISLSTGDVAFSASVSDLIKIKTSTGNIHVENTSAGVLDLSATTGGITVSDVACTGDVMLDVTTGKTTLTDLSCSNLISDGDTGSILLKNVIANGKFNIERNTGNVKFDGADAAEIFVETDTGNVTGSLLTDKVYITETDTGRIDVPKTVSGGKCEITTDTGDIKITTK